MKIKLVLILMTSLLVDCSSKNEEAKNSESFSIGPVAYAQRMKETPEAVVLDVRTADEFQTGNIANSINLDFNNPDFKKLIEQQNKDRSYFVYCGKGSRSKQAVELMQGLGFKNVYHLEGGINGWKTAGLPVNPGIQP